MRKKKKILIGAIIITIIIIIFLLVKIALGPAKYEVKFDSAGGSAVSSLKVEDGKLITKPKDPTRDGYTFVGWYYNGEIFDFSTKITKDITLEARWMQTGEGKVSGVSLNTSSLTLKVGEEETLKATIKPSDAKNKDVEWTSSDEEVATVDEFGKVVAKKAGKTTITVTTKEGNFKATCLVTVSEDKISVVGVHITGDTTVYVGKTIKLKADIRPAEATDKTVTWTSSNKNIATVDNNGNVKGISEGKATITVTTKDGEKTDKVTITVKKEEVIPTVEATGIEISGEKEVLVRKDITLSAKVIPDNATNKKVTWESSDNGIATVDANGKVTGVKSGTVKIRAKVDNVVAEYEITVKEDKDAYVIKIKNKELELGGSLQVIYEVYRYGEVITNYQSFQYGKMTVTPESGTLPKIDNSITSTTLKLSDGTELVVTIEY